MPMVNILSGEFHAGWHLDIQDVLFVPIGAAHYAEAMERVPDEGGLGPRLESNEAALALLTEGIHRAGLE